MRDCRAISVWLWFSVVLWGSAVCAADPASSIQSPTATLDRLTYQIQAGDVLDVSVWKETDLQKEVLVRPDGSFSFPLAGEVDARGKTVDEVRAILVERLQKFVPSPSVSVAVKQIAGNRVYVVGRVNRAGDFPLTKALDVMQAISLAGGLTPFAAVNDIVILRRHNGRLEKLKFRYRDVARGRHLEQNVLLETGDTVVVP